MTRSNITHLVLVLALAAPTWGCGNQAEETANETQAASESAENTAEQTEATPEATPITLASILARIGGTRIVAGQFGVELFPRASGEMTAIVSKADGAIVQGANVTVSMKGSDGAMHDVALSWDANASAYVGAMPGGAVQSGPARVSVTADGATGEAEVAAMAVAPTPVYGGHVVVLGDVAAEVRTDPAGVVFVTATGPNGALNGDAGLDLKANVAGSDGQTHEVALAWDAPSMAFVGALPAEVTLGSGALALEATMNGETKTGGFETIAVAAPTHGGDIIAAADMSVELVPASATTVDVYVTDAAGAAVTGAAEVSMQLPGLDAPTTLTWDANAGKYTGEIPANVDISVAPIAVNVVHDGKRCHGAMAASAGHALGVRWRQRLASGAGGAIPPGQAAKLEVNADLRGRLAAHGHGHGDVNVEVAGGPNAHVRGQHGGMVEVNVPNANGAAVEVRGAAANVRGAAVDVRGVAADIRGRAGAVRVQVNTPTPPPPPSVMVNATASTMASAGGNASAMSSGASGSGTGGVSIMGGASVMVGF